MLLLALRALARRARTPIGRPELLLALLLLSEAEQTRALGARSGKLGSASAAKLLRSKSQTAGTAVPVAPNWFAFGEPVGGSSAKQSLA